MGSDNPPGWPKLFAATVSDDDYTFTMFRRDCDLRDAFEGVRGDILSAFMGSVLPVLDRARCNGDVGTVVPGLKIALRALLSDSECKELAESIGSRHTKRLSGGHDCHHDLPFPVWTGVDVAKLEQERQVEVAARKLRIRRDDLLNQQVEWIDAAGRVWLLTEMEASHRENVQRHLRRTAAHRMRSRAFEVFCYADTAPDGASMAAEQAGDEYMNDSESPEKVDEWVSGFPLMRRLVELDGVHR